MLDAVLQIGPMRISLAQECSCPLDTAFVQRALELYAGNNAAGCDFTVRILDKLEFPFPNNTSETRNGIRYWENREVFAFQTQTVRSLINWPAGTMHLAFVRRDESVEYDRMLFEQMKLLVSLLTLERGGLPLHCSAVAGDQDTGLVFVGPSGAGKTTIGMLLFLDKTWRLLNDEFNILLPQGEEYEIVSTPLTHPNKFRYCTAGRATVKNLYVLEKSTEERTEDLDRRTRYFSLLSNTYSFPTSARFGQLLMENAEKTADKVPIERLYFTNSRTVARSIERFVSR